MQYLAKDTQEVNSLSINKYCLGILKFPKINLPGLELVEGGASVNMPELEMWYCLLFAILSKSFRLQARVVYEEIKDFHERLIRLEERRGKK